MSNNPIAIDASDLQYYDKQIKKYIDDKDAELKASLSNLSDIDKKLDKISEDVAVLLDDRDEAETNISRLQDMDSAILGELGNIKADINTKLDESAMEYLATKEYVDQAILNAELQDKEIDLSNYYTKSETNQAISDAISTIPQPDLSEYAKKSEIPNVSDFVTNSDLDSREFVTQDILSENYATKDFVDDSIASINEKIDNIKIPAFVSELTNDAGYITANDIPEVDLSNYYNREEVDNLIQGIDIPTVPTNISAFTNDVGYTTEQFVLDHVSTTIETEVETQVTEAVEKQVTEVIQIQVKDEVTEQLANNNKIQYGEF